MPMSHNKVQSPARETVITVIISLMFLQLDQKSDKKGTQAAENLTSKLVWDQTVGCDIKIDTDFDFLGFVGGVGPTPHARVFRSASASDTECCCLNACCKRYAVNTCISDIGLNMRAALRFFGSKQIVPSLYSKRFENKKGSRHKIKKNRFRLLCCCCHANWLIACGCIY